jgi:hypothetical protein
MEEKAEVGDFPEVLSDQVDVSINRPEGLILNQDIFRTFIDKDMSRKEKEIWAACRFTISCQ